MPNKAIAAGGGVGLGGAITTLIVAIWWTNADAASVAALTTIINSVLGGLAAWAMPAEK